MNNKRKIIIIDAFIGSEMAQRVKQIAEIIGVSETEMTESVKNVTSQIQKASIAFNGLSIGFEKLKVSVLETPKQKSNYINRPKNNFKNRGIPQKRNNGNYYNKR